MTCPPSQTARTAQASHGRDRSLQRATALLDDHGCAPVFSSAVEPTEFRERTAATATALMDLFRRTGEAEVFESLVELATPELLVRVRSRLRSLGGQFDPHEVLQDAIVNIFRYPDRFVASRPNAFAAWSATIVDNAIRRQLRRRTGGPTVALSPSEVLAQQADLRAIEPDREAVAHEESVATASAFGLLLTCYVTAFETLGDRERFVLQMVEVQRMRYADVARLLGIRPEAIKMVVFRGRKRIFERMGEIFHAGRQQAGRQQAGRQPEGRQQEGRRPADRHTGGQPAPRLVRPAGNAGAVRAAAG